MLFVWQWHKDVRYKTIYVNLVTFLGIAVVLLGVNLITGGNYMYIMGPPHGETAITLVFGPYPTYIINIFLFGIPVIFHLFYIPFFIRDLGAKKALTA